VLRVRQEMRVCSYLDLVGILEASKEGKMSSENQGDAADAGTFLGRMRHHLRTALNPILGYSEILIEDAQEDGEDGLVEILRQINKSGESILGRINEIVHKEKVENDPDLNVSKYERELREAIEPDCENVLSRCDLLESQPAASEELLSDVAKMREGVTRLENLLNEMRNIG